ncbi:molybdenum cofactor cytidylyltransferase [Shewanella psychropiezotolerans]|uniref:Molybdenum cofactor cytidylyltransferase n=1 Tax=Shewanella psychropiezotolerans TaxID=2593655 RepID=A0ABX5WZW7_9GAMM|nr:MULTISPECIES: NTP transferase domain-containing protein [Shewanella]MPY22400.1 molybdenum cofactor cytidylyltransferase [Shewanella sp. YLB-07]QDO83278.1 molybdenum cofactor cytidylyltransferase [Shewanella psychropiezotolerans]
MPLIPEPVYQNIDCVMPAAGLSSRMGDWKMMLAYRHHTILDQSIENALSFCSRVILVAGHRGQELLERYRDRPNVLVVINEQFTQGMFTSIQVGVAQVNSEYFFIAHGDMPNIGADVFRAMWQLRGESSLFPGDTEHSGHPVLLPSSLALAIIAAPAGSKMKSILNRKTVTYMGLTTPVIHQDVDTPEAYQALINAL